MNQVMRQRLLGILVLLALASILLPLLLDFRPGREVDTRPQLPPAPEIRPTPLPQLDQPIAQTTAGDPAATATEAPQVTGNSAAEALEAAPAAQPVEPPPVAVAPPPKPAAPGPEAPPPPREVPAQPQKAPPQPQKAPPKPQKAPPANKAAPFELPDADPRSVQSRTSAVPKEPGLDAKGMPRAWVLQLGVFAQEKNALDLRNRLLAGGHRAFVQAAKPGQPRAYRVFVGPKTTRAQLFAEQREMERKFKIKPMVVPFAP